LGEQRLRIDDHAVADDAGDAGEEDAGGHEPQDELRAVDVDGVPGVVAALVAGHDRELRRQQIDNLALAFVTPLRTEDCQIHRCLFDNVGGWFLVLGAWSVPGPRTVVLGPLVRASSFVSVVLVLGPWPRRPCSSSCTRTVASIAARAN